jgi:mitochondrial protein import protein ZIM17
MTVEDLMREQGQLIKKGTLSEDGDLEFWEDGTTTTRKNDDTVSETDGQKRVE